MVRQAFLIAREEPGLQSMTHGLPAAMLPLLDEPLAGLLLHLLRRHGVERVTVIAEDGRIGAALGRGELYGVQVGYAEGWPGMQQEDVFVLQGSILTDVDLSELYRQHEAHGTPITSAVLAERPSQGMGVLILSPLATQDIPQGCEAENIFPVLSECGRDMHAAEMSGYWCPVEDLTSYRRAQTDLLGGRVGLPVRGRRQGSAILAPGCDVPGDVQVTGRCYVGRFAQVGHGVVLGSGTVIGRGAQVGGRAYLENACLMENAAVDKDAILRNVLVIPRYGNSSLQQMIPFGRI